MVQYPAILPRPQVSTFREAFDAYARRTAVLGGRSRFRRVSARTLSNYALKFIFTQEEMAVFEAWFEVDLQFGSISALMPMRLQSGFEEFQEVNFVGTYEYSLEGNNTFIVDASVQRVV